MQERERHNGYPSGICNVCRHDRNGRPPIGRQHHIRLNPEQGRQKPERARQRGGPLRQTCGDRLQAPVHAPHPVHAPGHFPDKPAARSNPLDLHTIPRLTWRKPCAGRSKHIRMPRSIGGQDGGLVPSLDEPFEDGAQQPLATAHARPIHGRHGQDSQA